MRTRLTLITEIIAPYRIPVFNALMAHPEIDLHVIFLAENDASLRQWQVYKQEIRFSYEILRSVRWRVGHQTVLLNWGITRALRAARSEVVVCGGYNYVASWRAAYWARGQGIPFLLWTESNAADQRGGRPLVESFKRRFLELCSGFLVPGRSSASYLELLGVASGKIFTAPNAIDLSLFQKKAAEARQSAPQIRARLGLPPRYFLNVGRQVTAKGVFDLLDAYARLDAGLRSEIGLVFVGDGPQRPELAARAQSIAPGVIQFQGFVQRDDLACFYVLAEALVFPTHSDPWGFVVNEAMTCGVPVIASNVAGCVADLVKDSQTGLVVPPLDPPRLSDAMEFLAKQTELRSRMGKQAAELSSHYSPEAWAEGVATAAKAMAGFR